jgi:type II secretory pathway pseudopilin PulG
VAKVCSSKVQKGFTLVELLTSVIVIVAIGSIITGIITSSLRGSNKANTIENIRQAGDYVLNQMAKDIEYSQTFDGSNTGFKFDDDPKYYTSCPTDPLAKTLNNITIRSTKDLLIAYECHDSSLLANGAQLIDTNSSIDVQNCSFVCAQSDTGVPIIKISFILGSKRQNNSVESSNPPVTFETAVTMRNYSK